MHCSDEDLIAYLDGELSLLKRKAVARHLQSCWSCRTRLAEAEQQICQLAKEMEEWSFPGTVGMAQAKRRLNAGIREFEGRTSMEPQFRPQGWRPVQMAWTTGIAVPLLAALILFLPDRLRETASAPVTAAAAITRAAAIETELYDRPLHETMAVEITELRPVRRTRTTRLNVWSDRRTGRFATRVVDHGGATRHAVWKPGISETEVFYNPAVSMTPVARPSAPNQPLPLTSLADYGLDIAQVETAFVRWLESGAGRAVSFTRDLAVWSHQDGTKIAADMVRMEGNSPAIRVTAQRTSNRLTAVLRVDYDSDSYRPRLQALRFETPDAAVEFRLATVHFKLVSSTELKNELFSPATDLPLEAADRDLRPPMGLAAVAELTPPQPHGSSKAELELLEAHYVLHQTGACLGESVHIEEQPGGVRIRSLGRGPFRESFTANASLSAVLSAFADVRDAAPASADLPDGVDRGFGWAVALRHAWALARMARNFPPSVTSKMAPESWRVLDIMVRDHVKSISAELKPFQAHHASYTVGSRHENSWRHSSSVVMETLMQAVALINDEPMAKVVPLLQEVDSELHVLSAEFQADQQRSRLTVAKELR